MSHYHQYSSSSAVSYGSHPSTSSSHAYDQYNSEYAGASAHARSSGWDSQRVAAGASGYGASAGHSSSGNQYSSGSSSRYASSGSNQGAYQSQIEQAVIQAKEPLQVQEREQIQAGPYRGVYLNRQEVQNWRGPVPIDQYRINEDQNPEVIRKRLDKVRYQQEVAVRYLQPPLPPKPGDLIIRERQGQIPPAPPVVLRQEAGQAQDPAPLVLRERPPRPPAQIQEQTVEVEGAPVPPPARRVVLEKLTALPPRPQNVIIERWLPYKQQKRRVVYQKSCATAPQNPRNLIIEWEAPEVEVEKVCRDLGVVQADPEEYIRRYGPELKDASELPSCEGGPAAPRNQCGGVSGPAVQSSGSSRHQLAADVHQESSLPELEGEIQALKLVDLERHGLGAYRRYVQ